MDLAAAYRAATWGDDTLRADMIRAQQAANATGRAAEQRESVARARAAATPRTANVAVADAKNPWQGLSLDQTIDQAFAELGVQ